MMFKRAFTLIELLVVISIIALLIAILLPALGAARNSARVTQSQTQIRGIQQGMHIFSQSNKDLYPGMDKLTTNSQDAFADVGDIDTYVQTEGSWLAAGADVQARYIICLNDNVYSPDYLISPLEVNSGIEKWDRNSATGYRETSLIHSYALPRIRKGSNISPGRAREWRADANPSAIVVSDRLFRNSGSGSPSNNGDPDTHYSLQSTESPGQWTGGISFNDNHTESFKSSEYEDVLKYGGIETTDPDNIFAPTPLANQNAPAGLEQDYNSHQVIRKSETTMLPSGNGE